VRDLVCRRLLAAERAGHAFPRKETWPPPVTAEATRRYLDRVSREDPARASTSAGGPACLRPIMPDARAPAVFGWLVVHDVLL